MKMEIEKYIVTKPATMVTTTKIKSSVFRRTSYLKDTKRDSLYRNLLNEDCEDFYNYVDWLDLVKSPNIIVIPATNSFFYIPEDMAGTETVINLKPLNLIKNVKAYLDKMHSFLPEYTYLTGCYEDYFNGDKRDRNFNNTGNNMREKTAGRNTDSAFLSASKISHLIHELFTRRLRTGLTRESARALLQDAGFTVLDITPLNNKTYFCAQKRPPSLI